MTIMQQVEFILTLIFFLAGVAACITGVVLHIAWIGPAFVMTFTLVYLLASKPSITQIKLIFCVLIMSYTSNSLLQLFKVIHFAPMAPMLGQLPIWFISVWVMFAVLFHRIFHKLNNLWAAAIIGLGFIPLIYLLTYHLAIIQLPLGMASMIILCITWAMLLPILIRLREFTYTM
jgi:hypothetical protein